MSQRDSSRQFLGCSQDVFSPHGEEDFCTRDNWQVSIIIIIIITIITIM